MCSQPPKKSHQDRFTFFQKAAMLAPHGLTITITGGEPTLHKESLFEFFRTTLAERPDLRFRVLSNAQHFAPQDRSFLEESRRSVSWGIPLYSANAAHHDEVVGKVGAFAQLLTGLAILGSAGAAIELRTVVTRQTLRDLVKTAEFVAANVAFATTWAIMQLEAAGYARTKWNELFADTSTEFEEVAKALDIAKLRGVDALLFNFPLCTIPSRYRSRAPRAISDWKTKYLRQCRGCSLHEQCGGFFEWYPEAHGFQKLELQ
jgi:His-Xaa-Ser system radical SAM maturase HxsC